jgi:hypothetical protein
LPLSGPDRPREGPLLHEPAECFHRLPRARGAARWSGPLALQTDARGVSCRSGWWSKSGPRARPTARHRRQAPRAPSPRADDSLAAGRPGMAPSGGSAAARQRIGGDLFGAADRLGFGGPPLRSKEIRPI